MGDIRDSFHNNILLANISNDIPVVLSLSTPLRKTPTTNES